jgi:hypothetical protein
VASFIGLPKMGKRPRVPHFITGIGDGNVKLPDLLGGGPNDDIFAQVAAAHQKPGVGTAAAATAGASGTTGTGAAAAAAATTSNNKKLKLTDATRQHALIRSRNERLGRLEDPPMQADHWKDVFASEDSTHPQGVTSSYSPLTMTGPWQVSAFMLLGMIVVLSAVFLHLLSESQHDPEGGGGSYSNRRRQQQQRQRRLYKTRKKKTDEWSDDEEELQNALTAAAAVTNTPTGATTIATTAITPTAAADAGAAASASTLTPEPTQFYYYPPKPQEHTLSSSAATHHARYNMNYAQQVPAYKSPSSNLRNLSSRSPNVAKSIATTTTAANAATAATTTRRTTIAGPSSQYTNPYSAAAAVSSHGAPHSGMRLLNRSSQAMTMTTTIDVMSQELLFPLAASSNSSSSGAKSSSSTTAQQRLLQPLATPFEGSPLLTPNDNDGGGGGQPHIHQHHHHSGGLNARVLSMASNFSSFESIPGTSQEGNSQSPISERSLSLEQAFFRPNASFLQQQQQHHHHQHSGPSSQDDGFANSISRHQNSLLLSSGNANLETPRVGNVRRMINAQDMMPMLADGVSLQQRLLSNDGSHLVHTAGQRLHPDLQLLRAMESGGGGSGILPPGAAGGGGGGATNIPFIPTLEKQAPSSRLTANANTNMATQKPPRSLLIDELKLVQMETGNSMHWEVQQSMADDGSYASRHRHNQHPNHHRGLDTISSPAVSVSSSSSGSGSNSSDDGSDISIPSNDPRKSIIHKRKNLTMSTDSARSLQSSIQFEELKFQEVIGGGGFGQVWRANWRGTPVAVKILTGSAQGKHIAKAILEEFRAEINLLKVR